MYLVYIRPVAFPAIIFQMALRDVSRVNVLDSDVSTSNSETTFADAVGLKIS